MPTIDRSCRPASYWEHADARAAVLQNIKGQNRRVVVARHVDGVVPDSVLDLEVLADTITEDDRRALGALHPSWLGGEYLPDYLPGEVEVARIVLASATQDVVSVRARRRGRDRRIRYRVVDEYGSDIACTPRSSRRPLAVETLIGLIDAIDLHDDGSASGAGFVERVLGRQGVRSPAELEAFVRVESVFYPELEAHYVGLVRRVARGADEA